MTRVAYKRGVRPSGGKKPAQIPFQSGTLIREVSWQHGVSR